MIFVSQMSIFVYSKPYILVINYGYLKHFLLIIKPK